MLSAVLTEKQRLVLAIEPRKGQWPRCWLPLEDSLPLPPLRRTMQGQIQRCRSTAVDWEPPSVNVGSHCDCQDRGEVAAHTGLAWMGIWYGELMLFLT